MNLTIKNVPTALHRQLRARASANNRSLNGEVIQILESALSPGPVPAEEFIRRVKAIHSRLAVRPLTDTLLDRAKREGRR